MTWFERTRYYYFGKFCLLVFTRIGAWCSVGIHLSISPPCLDLHIGWWMLSLTSRRHGKECEGYEEEQDMIREELLRGGI